MAQTRTPFLGIGEVLIQKLKAKYAEVIERHRQSWQRSSVIQALPAEPQCRIKGVQLCLNNNHCVIIQINAGVSRQYADIRILLVHGYPLRAGAQTARGLHIRRTWLKGRKYLKRCLPYRMQNNISI